MAFLELSASNVCKLPVVKEICFEASISLDLFYDVCWLICEDPFEVFLRLQSHLCFDVDFDLVDESLIVFSLLEGCDCEEVCLWIGNLCNSILYKIRSFIEVVDNNDSVYRCLQISFVLIIIVFLFRFQQGSSCLIHPCQSVNYFIVCRVFWLATYELDCVGRVYKLEISCYCVDDRFWRREHVLEFIPSRKNQSRCNNLLT